jgi:hypothetical protein
MQIGEKLLPPLQNARASRGAMTVSAGFYLGMAVVLAVAIGGAVNAPSRPLVDQHANPAPAERLPAQLVTAPGSNLYHASASCPYAHLKSTPLSASEAVHRGLVPCPYCIGNSSARLTPTVRPRRAP